MITGGDAAQWAATGIVALGLVFTILRNGRSQKVRDEKIATEQGARGALIQEKLKTIDEAIKSPETGLAALKEDMNSIKNNCAKVTSGFTERIKSLEKSKRR